MCVHPIVDECPLTVIMPLSYDSIGWQWNDFWPYLGHCQNERDLFFLRIASVGGTLSRNMGKLKVVWWVGIYLMHAYKNENQLRFGFGPIVLLSVQDNTCKNKDVQAVLLYYLVMLPYNFMVPR